jgi:hypothetical protein
MAMPCVGSTLRQRFEEAHQVGGCSRALERRRWQGSGAVRPHEFPVSDGAEGRLGRTFNRPWSAYPCRPPASTAMASTITCRLIRCGLRSPFVDLIVHWLHDRFALCVDP